MDAGINLRIITYPHYGEGFVLEEDDNLVVVRFEGFGDKQFMKVFNEVEILDS